MVASDFKFFSRILSELNGTLTTYVSDTASSVIGAITPVATTLLTIYVVLWGWSMMRGVISEPIMDAVGRMVRLAIIVGIALNIGRYNGFIADFLWQSPDAMAAVISGQPGTSSVSFLDTLMSKMYDLGEIFYQNAQQNSGPLGVPDMGQLGIAILIWVVGLITTAYAAFLVILSKVALAVILGIGPIFVLLIMFEATKRFFDAWMGQALNFVFLVILSSAVIKLILTVLQIYLDQVIPMAAAKPSADQVIPAFGIAIIGCLVLVQVPAKASALAGGVAISTLGAVSWAYGKSKSTASSLRPTNIRRSARRAAADMNLAGSAIKSVATAPAAVYRKVTGAGKNSVSKS